MKLLLRCLAALAVAGLIHENTAQASNARDPATPAQLIVEDNGQFFTPGKIEEAKAIIAKSMGAGNRQVHIETYKALTAEEKKGFDEAKDKKKFWHDWAISKAKGDRGISIFIVKDPPRFEVLVDRQMHTQGFDDAKEAELKKLIGSHLGTVSKAEGDAAKQKEMDGTLIAVADHLEKVMPTTVMVANQPRANQHQDGNKAHDQKQENKEGSKIGTYICIGAVVLLGIWLVVGLFRAFSGGGMGGGAGGGGGFGTALLGGLFGAMAGMWLYNSFFGSNHDASAFGGDPGMGGGGDYGSSESSGAGDYGGDQGTGGDWGGGGGDTGGGGGDWGGGGGDFGGGGDW